MADMNLCDIPGFWVVDPGCAGQATGAAINQATGNNAGNILNWLINPKASSDAAAAAVNQATGNAGSNIAQGVLDAFAQVAGAKSFIDLEQRGLLLGGGIFFIFLGFIVLFFAHGGGETVVNLASPTESEAASPGEGESNAAKVGQAAKVAEVAA